MNAHTQRKRHWLFWGELGFFLGQQLLNGYVRSKKWRVFWWVSFFISGVLLKLLVGLPADPWIFFWSAVPQLPLMVVVKGPLLPIFLWGTVLWSIALAVPWLLLLCLVCIAAIGELTLWQRLFEKARKQTAQHARKGAPDVSLLERTAPSTPFTAEPLQNETQARRRARCSSVVDQDTQPLATLQHVTDEEEQVLRQRWQGAVSGTAIHPGFVREDNQDGLFAVSLLVTTDQGLEVRGIFIIADGIGGQTGGKEASTHAIRAVAGTLLTGVVTLNTIEDDHARLLLWQSVQHSNGTLYQLNSEKQVDERMGTTLTVALLLGTRVFVANVGDSRTYLYQWRHQSFKQITVDHSHVAQLVSGGAITREDMYTHPDRNLIYRSLGNQPLVEVDTFLERIEPGDKLLLCSDGAWEMVRDSELKHIVRQQEHPETLAATLLEAALESGGEDNFSAIVVHVAPC